MTRLATITALLLSICILVPSPASADLVMHLAFDGDLTDSSGFGNDAVIVGPVGNISTGSPGLCGNALSILGGSTSNFSYLRVDNSSSISPRDAITMSAWVNPTGRIGDNAGIFFKGALIGRQADYQLFIDNSGGQAGGAITAINGTGASTIEAIVRDVFFLRPIPLGVWTHLAATYDGNVLRLYVNGTLVGEDPHIDTIDQSGSPLFIGNRFTTGRGNNFSGLMDDLKIFDTAISADEIGRLVIAGSAGMCQENPFADFTINKAEVEFGTHSRPSDSFEVRGEFTLGTGNDGIDLNEDDVEITVGTASVTILAGSFVEDGSKFKFKGAISGVDVKMKIEETDINTFKFKVKAKGVDLTDTANPLEVRLIVGDDAGMANEWLEGELEFEKDEEEEEDEED